MPASTDRVRGVASVVVLLALALASPAVGAQPAVPQQFDEPAPPAPPAPPPAPPAQTAPLEPILGARLEARAGLDAPLGTVSGALVFQPTPMIAFGVGVGAATGQPLGPYLQLGGFVRANLWRRGRYTLGPVLTFSGGRRRHAVSYQWPQYVATDNFLYKWEPGYRMDAGVGGEAAFERFSLRVEAGLGLYLNDPSCQYDSAIVRGYWGPCDGPQIPQPYHFTFYPGQLAPYLSLAVAYNMGRAPAQAAAAASEPQASGAAAPPARTDSAWLAPTALTVPAGSVTVALYEALHARLTLGVADRLQFWLGSSLTVFAGLPTWEVGAKVRLVSAGRFHLALFAEHFGARGSWSGLLLTGGGAVASVCLDAGCASVLSLSGGGGWLHEDHDESRPETTTGALVSPSAVVQVARYLKVVVESHLPSSAPGDGLWVALLRLPLGRLTIDLGALGVYSELDVAPAGTIGYRW